MLIIVQLLESHTIFNGSKMKSRKISQSRSWARPFKKHLVVWYYWGQEDKVGSYLESSMEDFVYFLLQDYHDIFGKYSRDASTPTLPGIVLRKNPDKVTLHKRYRSMVGKLLFFVKKVGPVCANACRKLSQYLEK